VKIFFCALLPIAERTLNCLTVPWLCPHALLVSVLLKFSYEVMLDSYCEGKTEVLGENPIPVPLCLRQSYMDRLGLESGPPP
jgi:hypothetical protein